MPQQLASLGSYHPPCPDLHRPASIVCTVSARNNARKCSKSQAITAAHPRFRLGHGLIPGC